MTKRSDTASRAGDLTEEQKLERDAINRELDDIDARIRHATGRQDIALIQQAVGRVRQRLIAFARMMGGATFARMMRPHDDVSGDNVVRFRRRMR